MIKIDFSTSKNITLLLASTPTFDFVASALALKLSLESFGKTVNVICSDPMTVDFNRLVGINTVSAVFGSRNLVITLPGQTDLVDKVSYNVDSGELELVIVPKEGKTLDPNSLKITPGMATPDLAILVGITDLTQTKYTESLANVKLIYFNDTLDSSASCLSELAANLIKAQELPINADVATNLMQGLTKSTNGFTSAKVSKATFELAAWLMEHGSRHQDEISASSFPSGSIPAADPDWYEPKIYKGTTLS